MPHLSPLNWFDLPPALWVAFLSTTSVFWWMQSPKLTFSTPFHSPPSLPWTWL